MALLTVALLTMALLTMALLTMALLTMALVTVALVTVALPACQGKERKQKELIAGLEEIFFKVMSTHTP